MRKRIRYISLLIMILTLMLSGCDADPASKTDRQGNSEVKSETETTEEEPERTIEPENEPTSSEDYTEGFGDTFSGTTNSPENAREDTEETGTEDENKTVNSKDVDLIFFMGQSNMSGAAGDATLAPYVSEEAGMEFRAVSDPTTLYPITEPFGINENRPGGLNEYPGAKKGSLVSAFINEYHEETGRKVIAVSMSMGATDMDTWMSAGVTSDIKQRFDTSVSYLKNNGYTIGHMYAVWLHGESDAIKGTDPEVYRTDLDSIMRPLFIGGVRKVFLIVPGRTIDYRDIFLDIINVQKQICAESDYYALATTVLTRVSTEYMKDQYHYNQHVLNMVGIEAAKAVAYYTEHNVEKIVYDYREKEYIIQEGVDENSQPKDEIIDLSGININEVY